MEIYSKQTEKEMKDFYDSLNEKQKREYVATEAKKLGWGGQKQISKILGCCRQTISKGICEKQKNFILENRIRQKGGGRKPYFVTHPDIDEKFEKCIENNTAGNPCGREVKWTNLENKEIVELLKKEDVEVSVFVVRKHLKKNKYVKRSHLKKKR
jgi:hypothetical protein